MSIIHTDLRCNDTEVFKNPCVIEEVVELPAHEFSAFSHHLTDDYPFIHKMAARLTCDSRGVHHCLLVLCEGQDDGILVKSEGYDYARYHSYLSNARQYVNMVQHPALEAFASKLCTLAGTYVEQALRCQIDGQYHIPLDAIREQLGYGTDLEDLFLETLTECPQIEEAELDEDVVHLFLNDEYLTLEKTDHLRRLTAQEVEVMCAKHTLWLHDAGGCRADFSDCLLEDLTITNRCLDYAVFDGAKLSNCSLRSCELNHASFRSARIYNCDMASVSAEDATFRDARLLCTFLHCANLNQSNFTGAMICSSSAVGVSMNDCCFEDTDFTGTALESARMDRPSYSEGDWLDESPAPGMTM